MSTGSQVVDILHYRYAKLYREQVSLWHSRRFSLWACHQIAAQVCRSRFAVRISGAEMKALNAHLRGEALAAAAAPVTLEEAS